MPKEPLKLSLLGLTLPIPRWTVTWFGLIAVLGVAGLVYREFFPNQLDLVTLRQANHLLALQISEYNKHIAEDPERHEPLMDDARGLLAVRLYADGCLVIQRRSPSGMATKLVPDLTRADLEHAAGDEEVLPRYSARGLLPVAHAQGAACRGRCLNPHAGKFLTKTGARDGCWIEIWRLFEDGCEHVQMFNSCTGTWESNSDGSPRVRWRCCRH